MANSKDVALAAGTSQSTVSRVFRGEPNVGPELIARVKAAAKSLNYVPNDAARSLLQGKTRRIALVVEKLTQPAFALMADITHDELLKRNYRVIVLEADSPGGGVRDGSREIFSAVDGVLYCSADRTTDLTGFVEEVSKPIVLALRAGHPETFVTLIFWVDSSKTQISVNVPPTSTATRRSATVISFDCGVLHSLALGKQSGQWSR